MNKFLVVLAALAMFSCQKQSVIEITATDMPDDTKVDILTSDIGNPMPTVVASGVIKEGKVSIENPFTEFDEGYITIGEDKKTNVFFIAEPGNITVQVVKDKPTETVIGGTENNTKLQALQTESKTLTEKLMSFMETNQMKLSMLAQSDKEEEKEQLKVLENEFNGYVDQIKSIYKKYQDENPDNEFGLLLFYQQMMSQQGEDLETLKASFDKFSPNLKENKIGKKIVTLLEMSQNMKDAQMAVPAPSEIVE